MKILYLSFFEKDNIIFPKKYKVTTIYIFSNDFKLNILKKIMIY